MSSGTKILLSIFALLIGGLMLYYSVLGDGTLDPRLVANGPDPSADPLNAPASAMTEDPAPDLAPMHADPLGSPEATYAVEDEPSFDPSLSVDPLASGGMGLLTGAVARSTDPTSITARRGLPPAVAVTSLPLINEPVEPDPAVTRFYEHTVRPGETLSSIAMALLGAERRWREIAVANPSIDPDRLRVGQHLKIPAAAAVDPPRLEPAEPRAGDGETYIVRSGDTLSSIASHTLGASGRWHEIHAANRRAIGRDADRLKVGMRLVIPKR